MTLISTKPEGSHFEEVLNLIKQARLNATHKTNEILIDLYWTIGEYIFNKIRQDGWGQSTISELSNYILSREPGAKGFSTPNLRRMRQFYETYKDSPHLKPLLRLNTWTNNLSIMRGSKTEQEREFYLHLASKEHYSTQELDRQIDSGYYQRLMLSNGEAPSGLSKRVHNISSFRDNYLLEFVNLPQPYQEKDLQKAILDNLRDFILEFGRDFIFMGQEYHIQVSNHDYYIDLLFYHRGLQCLVAFELKVDEFKPEYLGKMNFYLTALDNEVRKPHENPSVGIILCRDKDNQIIQYSMNKDLSATLVAKYETELIDKDVLQKKLDELYDLAKE